MNGWGSFDDDDYDDGNECGGDYKKIIENMTEI
jgi:hypothetical protein